MLNVHEEERMRRYEQVYILRPSMSEDEITTLIESTNTIILKEQGTIIQLDKWGMRKLAYPIKKETQGFYVFCDFAGTPKAVAEIERKFRIDDTVLKYLSVKISDAIDAEEIAAAQDAAAAKASPTDLDDESENSPAAADNADDSPADDNKDKQ
jgi:small subunit ribosomal protein S6